MAENNNNELAEEKFKEFVEKITLLEEENSVLRELFERSPTSMWEEDITELIQYLDELRSRGNDDFESYFILNPDKINNCISKIRVININDATVKLHQAKSKEHLIDNLEKLFTPKAKEAFKKEIIALSKGRTSFKTETSASAFNKRIIELELHLEVTKRFTQGEKNFMHWCQLLILPTEKKRSREQLKVSRILGRY